MLRSRMPRIAHLAAAALGLLVSQPALADEGGVSFWIPGFFGSLAATPQQPGFSLATIYYHTSVTAGGDVAIARQIEAAGIKGNVNLNLKANLSGDANLGIVIPQYVFPSPILGGQAAVALLIPFGGNKVSVDATLTGSVGPIPIAASRSRTDTVTGFADLIPQFSLRWNAGVHNFMTYITGGIPVGTYNKDRLANLGLGHASIDGGAGYTYFNPQTGHEFSIVAGLTYNFINTHTDYQSGVDLHVDWGASKFLTKQLMVGLVGYAYQQLSPDSGAGDRLGAFESRVFGVGPQIGYIFPVGDMQGYVNLKGYKEFGAEHRPEGWNVWLTFAISPAAAPPPSTMIHK